MSGFESWEIMTQLVGKKGSFRTVRAMHRFDFEELTGYAEEESDMLPEWVLVTAGPGMDDSGTKWYDVILFD